MHGIQTEIAVAKRQAHTSEEMLTARTDKRRLAAASRLAPNSKSELGQFMTPAPVAEFMATLFAPVTQPEIRLLDPGAGVGSLTAAFL